MELRGKAILNSDSVASPSHVPSTRKGKKTHSHLTLQTPVKSDLHGKLAEAALSSACHPALHIRISHPHRVSWMVSNRVTLRFPHGKELSLIHVNSQCLTTSNLKQQIHSTPGVLPADSQNAVGREQLTPTLIQVSPPSQGRV